MTTQTTVKNEIKQIETMIKDIQSIRKVMRISHPEKTYNHLANAWSSLYRATAKKIDTLVHDDFQAFVELKSQLMDAINEHIKN